MHMSFPTVLVDPNCISCSKDTSYWCHCGSWCTNDVCMCRWHADDMCVQLMCRWCMCLQIMCRQCMHEWMTCRQCVDDICHLPVKILLSDAHIICTSSADAYVISNSPCGSQYIVFPVPKILVIDVTVVPGVVPDVVLLKICCLHIISGCPHGPRGPQLCFLSQR